MNERLMNKRNRQRLLALKRRLNFDRQQEQHLESLPADSNLNMNIAMKILSPGPTIMSSECSLHENSRLVQRLTGSHEELASSDCMKSNSNYCPASGRKSLTNDFTKNNSKANNSEIMIKKRRRIKRNQIQANNMWKTNLSLISKLLLSTATTAAISNGKRNLSNQQNALAWSKLLLLGGILLNVFCSMGVQSALNHVKLAHRVDLPDSQQSLLKSANVELNRSLRFQRDILPINNEQLTMGNGNHQAPTCGYPGSPAHASVTFNTSHVVAGTAASYTCDNGYELLGPPRRICQSNGTWSPIGIPFCVLNVGLGKAAMQSSTAGHGSAQKAVDGSTSAYFQAGTCTMTDVEHNPWWYVNLLEPYLVQIVRIDFGTACCANRQKATIAVRVGNNRPDLGNNPLCNRYHGFIEEGKPLFLPCTRPAPGAFVSIHLESPSGTSLSICETFIYTDHALSIEQCPSFRDQPLGSTATYNGKCYLFHNNQALDFDNARKYCESRGGTLVDETSPALQGFLSWELYRRHRNDQLMGQYWLGATRDTRNPQNWKWINGKDVQVSFWNSLESKGNCSRFDGSKGWLWSNTDCSTQLNFVCQYRPLSCGKPEKPTNSTLVSRNVDNGTVIEYQCAPGNLLMGPKSRACLPTGFFSEFAPKCKYLDCQFPAMIPNGDYKLLNGTTSYQSIVNYFCQDGYQLYGKATLQCDVDERWNGPPPRCEPLLCSAPVPPSNGYVTVTANVTVPGTQAEYGCRPGYELVGDRLLSCLTSGSWDNSFPYCRVSSTSTTSTPSTPTTTTTTTASITTPKPNQRIQQPQAKPIGSVSGSVQFPKSTNGQQPPALFTSSRISPVTQSSMQQPTTSTTLIPPAAASHDQAAEAAANSSSASLNGLANQFTSGHQAVATSNQGQQVEQDLRKLVVNQVQSVIPPLVALPAQPSAPTETQLLNNTPQPPRMFRPATQPNVVATTTTTTTTGLMQPQQQFGIQLQGQAPIVTQPNRQLPMNPGAGQTGGSTSASNKFSVVSQSGAPTSGQPVSSVIYDSSPLATTNSISVHQHQQQPTLPTTTTTATSSPAHTAPSPTVHSGFNGNQANVLGSTYAGSLGSSMRHHPSGNHNSLASAKYSLDGIIAVAIFGGFIFLGAIITIIVIIIRRRKSSHSSTIDAQTISTYDSNNEHNGLYRNYQQAWENLRFASPTSQPKSSGGPVGPMGLGPAVGLKTLASAANNAALIHHMHGAVGAAQVGMIASSTSSSQSSSSLGGANHAAGIDPLLRDHHHHHHNHSGHHHHHHHHANNARRVQQQQQQQLQQRDSARQEDDEEVMSDEQGVLSSDEANYQRRHSHHLHHHHHQSQLNEGFRDSNELTINADQVLNRNVTGAGGASVTGPMSGQVAAGGRRIYSSNGSIGRSNHRISGGNLSLAEHHSHHNHHHHGTSSNGSSQHQRLVSSSTPSTSTRSSRASPPSDDHSLDQLAYGNSWHPVVAGNQSINRE